MLFFIGLKTKGSSWLNVLHWRYNTVVVSLFFIQYSMRGLLYSFSRMSDEKCMEVLAVGFYRELHIEISAKNANLPGILI